MKIFSNFDTQLAQRLLEEAIHQYGEERVLLIKKSPIYFLSYIFLPLIGLVIAIGILFMLASYYTNNIEINIYFLVTVITVLIFIIQIFPIISRWIDYSMDFILVTPENIAFYNQTGIFKRVNKTVESRKIKTINVLKSGFIHSVFNSGDMVFLSEGDHTKGDITFPEVDDPEEVQKAIFAIIESGN